MSHGDCPKHGRWYGICHSCAKEMQDREDFIYRESVINERNRLRTELAAANERIHDLMLFVKDVDARCRRAHAKDVEFNDIGLWDLAKAELEKETP